MEVAAGTFENCVRVEVRQRSASDGYLSVSRETNWYKEGIGLIKSDWVTDGERFSGQLVEFKIPDKR